MSTTIEKNLTRDEWLERRVIGIGSSDAPVIAGVSPYKSLLQLYHEKRGRLMPHKGEVEHLRWGNILERPIATRYSEETGRPVEFPSEPGKFTLLRNIERPWQHASLDATVVSTSATPAPGAIAFPKPGNGVLEIKNASSYVGERWKDEPPVEFLVQLQHQMAVSGASWGSIAALIGGSLFLWQDIARDDAFIDMLVTLEMKFIARVEAGEEPPADGTEETKEFLKFLYPKDNGTVITLGPEWLDVESELVAVKKQLKEAEARKLLLENRLKQAIGDATMACLPNGSKFTFKWQTQAAHSRAAAEFRVLRHTGTKLPGGPRANHALPEAVEQE